MVSTIVRSWGIEIIVSTYVSAILPEISSQAILSDSEDERRDGSSVAASLDYAVQFYARNTHLDEHRIFETFKERDSQTSVGADRFR